MPVLILLKNYRHFQLSISHQQKSYPKESLISHRNLKKKNRVNVFFGKLPPETEDAQNLSIFILSSYVWSTINSIRIIPRNSFPSLLYLKRNPCLNTTCRYRDVKRLQVFRYMNKQLHLQRLDEETQVLMSPWSIYKFLIIWASI